MSRQFYKDEEPFTDLNEESFETFMINYNANQQKCLQSLDKNHEENTFVDCFFIKPVYGTDAGIYFTFHYNINGIFYKFPAPKVVFSTSLPESIYMSSGLVDRIGKDLFKQHEMTFKIEMNGCIFTYPIIPNNMIIKRDNEQKVILGIKILSELLSNNIVLNPFLFQFRPNLSTLRYFNVKNLNVYCGCIKYECIVNSAFQSNNNVEVLINNKLQHVDLHPLLITTDNMSISMMDVTFKFVPVFGSQFKFFMLTNAFIHRLLLNNVILTY